MALLIYRYIKHPSFMKILSRFKSLADLSNPRAPATTDYLFFNKDVHPINQLLIRPTNGALKQTLLDWEMTDVEVVTTP